MFRWILFWRFKRGQRAEKRDVLAVTEPAQIGVPEERRDALDSQGKDTETVTVAGSNTARALAAQNVVDDSECKLVLVRPAPLCVVPALSESAEKNALSTDVAAGDPRSNRRMTYFTHGCYAVTMGGPRLTAPDLILAARCGRFPVRQVQHRIAATKPGSMQLRSTAGQESIG